MPVMNRDFEALRSPSISYNLEIFHKKSASTQLAALVPIPTNLAEIEPDIISHRFLKMKRLKFRIQMFIVLAYLILYYC